MKKVSSSAKLKKEGNREKRKKLEELVSKITPSNKHKEIKWGKPIGQEIW